MRSKSECETEASANVTRKLVGLVNEQLEEQKLDRAIMDEEIEIMNERISGLEVNVEKGRASSQGKTDKIRNLKKKMKRLEEGMGATMEASYVSVEEVEELKSMLKIKNQDCKDKDEELSNLKRGQISSANYIL